MAVLSGPAWANFAWPFYGFGAVQSIIKCINLSGLAHKSHLQWCKVTYGTAVAFLIRKKENSSCAVRITPTYVHGHDDKESSEGYTNMIRTYLFLYSLTCSFIDPNNESSKLHFCFQISVCRARVDGWAQAQAAGATSSGQRLATPATGRRTTAREEEVRALFLCSGSTPVFGLLHTHARREYSADLWWHNPVWV